ncbi:hypothetical protein SKAU_G00109220 [Synaphobranchus kaupii]|uniref:Sulfotransferase n=1 Tax=Synaphobranchus kaupii TaxID=118154 RepID=A0A9Q1J7W9_SYNKA|nr:hypothetical protein SKAU_G00109220 [Synaphobranchus kaupii]
MPYNRGFSLAILRKEDQMGSWLFFHRSLRALSISMASPDQTETAAPPRPELFDFHGVSMTHYSTDNWDNVQNFQAKPDDILIATYPKAGTTWVSHMLDLLYFGKSSPKRGTSLPIYERVPFLEIYVQDLAPDCLCSP